jgi:iron complex outermembrane recepter protein
VKAYRQFLTATLLASASSLGLSAQAFAQDAKETAQSALEEIVVTANKREENLQLTPVAITAISAAQAELRGIAEVKDLASMAPNVTILQGTTNATAAVVTIRGIVTPGDESQGFDSPIGIYLDGVYIARSSAASTEVADIERVEVLRGPQGTLFGRNTTGGAINFISRLPGDEMMVKLKGGIGNYDLRSIRGTFDTGSLGGKMKMSFTGLYKSRDGTVDNLLQPEDSNDPGAYKTKGGRWALVLDATENLKITNIFDYTKITGVISASQFAAAGDGVSRGTISVGGGTFNRVTPAPVGPYLAQTQTRILEPGCPKTPSLARQDALCSEGAIGYSDVVWGNLFRVEADLDGLTLRSSTSYRRWKNIQDGTDLDGLGTINGPALGPPATTLNGFPASTLTLLGQPAGVAAFLASQPVFSANLSLFQTDNLRKNEQFSQEIELLSRDDGPLKWVVGAYFFSENGYERNPQRFGFILDTNAAIFNSNTFGAAAPLLQATNPARYRAVLQNSTLGYTAKGKSYALYGQATYRPGGEDGALGITLGLRYSWDKKSMDRFQNGAAPYTNPAEIALNSQDAKFSAPTGHLTIDYRVNDDVNLYAKVARGYRSGGFNARQTTIVGATAATSLGLVPFENETIWSYEAGFKTEFANRLRINGAFFYNQYNNYQTAVVVPIIGGGAFGTIVANAGKIDFSGFELESQLQITDIFSIDGNVGYVHKNLKEYITRDDSPARRETNIADAVELAYAPDWTATIAANARIPLTEETNITARVAYSYNSSVPLFGNAITNPFIEETKADARGLLEAQFKIDGISFGGGKDNLAITLWGKNLTNKEYVVRSVDFGQLGYAYTVYGEPRTWGLNLELAF